MVYEFYLAKPDQRQSAVLQLHDDSSKGAHGHGDVEQVEDEGLCGRAQMSTGQEQFAKYFTEYRLPGPLQRHIQRQPEQMFTSMFKMDKLQPGKGGCRRSGRQLR